MMRSIFCSRRSLFGFLLVSILITGLWPSVWADPTEPSGRDRNIVITVAKLLERDHLSKHPLDQEIGRRTITQFVKTLDPMKVYFYQSDVDGFMARSNEVENAKKGGMSIGYVMFSTFLKRVDERIALVDEFLAAQHDFTVDEDMLIDRDSMQFAKDSIEAKDRWRKRIKYDLLVLKADRIEKDKKKDKSANGEEPPEPKLTLAEEKKDDLDRLARRYHNFSKRMHQIDNDELLEMYLSSICSSFDPHTTYMSPDTVKNFIIQMRLNLEGIGASLQAVDGYTVIRQLITGGPAHKDGRLKVDDKIVGVGQGKEGPIQDVVDMKLTDVVKQIRGKAGTQVRLQIERGRAQERKVIEITRAAVELKESEARGKVFEAGRKADGKPYQLGLIKLPSFYMDMEGARLGKPNYRSTTRDVGQILADFNERGVDGLVLDLRGNGGGSLQEAINLTGLFIEEGPVVQVKDSRGNVRPYMDSDSGKMAWKRPMVVLIDKFSASASEILAGAIQDYGRGIIVGDRSTHGKGTVQSLMDLGEELFSLLNTAELGSLKITMQQFYRPSGDSTQQRGVLADVELPSLTTHLDVAEADLDYPVAFDKIDPQEFQKVNLVARPLVQKLREASAQRVRSSEDFRKVLRDISRYEEQKKRKMVTLNEKKFLEERAELNADREEEKKMEEMADPDRAEIKRDYYVDEALFITADYLRGLSGQAEPIQAVQTTKDS